MTEPHDWDDDEREAMAEFGPHFAALRQRHADDPPFDLLAAARGGALPDEWQGEVDAYLASSRWSRALADGAELPESVLDTVTEARILRRIRRATADAPVRTTNWRVPSILGGALAASVLAGVLAVGMHRPPQEAPAASVAAADPSLATPPIVELGPAPTPLPDPTPGAPVSFTLPLDKPDVRLSLRLMTWRGDAPTDPLMRDLKPGFDAYRAGDYKTADTTFGTLAHRYPHAIEPPFYQGIARLFRGDPAGALVSLTAAERQPDQDFVEDVSWYLAVAHERTGHPDRTVALLNSVCKGGGARAAAACAALTQLTAASPSNR